MAKKRKIRSRPLTLLRAAEETTEQADLSRNDDSADDDDALKCQEVVVLVWQWGDYTLVVRGTLRTAWSNAGAVGRACNETTTNTHGTKIATHRMSAQV